MRESLPDTYDSTFFLKTANLELTSACNLRCTYCTVSQPHYVGAAMPEETVAAALAGLRALKVDSVALNGHGETTTLQSWPEVAEALRRTGARVHLTSNLARVFTPDELDALSGLTSIVVSLDTDDAELLRRTRRGASLGTILENVRRVKEAARRRSVRCPLFVASCVVHTRNVMHLDRFVRFALGNGFRGFSFCNLNRSPEVPGALNVDHVTTLPREDLLAARRTLLEARAIAFSKGATCEIQSGLLDSIEAKLDAPDRCPDATVLNKRRHFRRAAPGETRRCLDPWFFVLLQADGAVRPCCWHPPVGSLGRGSFDTIVNGPEVVSLRRRLASGYLDEFCASCPARPVQQITGFRQLLLSEVPTTRLAAQLRRTGLSVKHALRRIDGAHRVSAVRTG
jgi:MoaA/NifB/PqqE/SkfB family radical SAM enzyme